MFGSQLLTQVLREPTGGGSLVDVLFVNRGSVGDVVVGGSLGQRDHKISEFSIVCEEGHQNFHLRLPVGGKILALFRTLIDRVSPEGQRVPGRLDML